MFIFVVVPINRGNSAEIYRIITWEVFKVGVALPGRVDIWGVTFTTKILGAVFLCPGWDGTSMCR
jgi:hypothetical protein